MWKVLIFASGSGKGGTAEDCTDAKPRTEDRILDRTAGRAAAKRREVVLRLAIVGEWSVLIV